MPRRSCAATSPFPCCSGRRSTKAIYLLGTSIARPLISKVCLQVAREVGADAYAHGATGKGNDQCRFQLAAEALNPAVKIIAPWRIEKFRQKFPGRTRDDRLLQREEHPGEGVGQQAVQLRRELPAHQLRGGQARRPGRQRRGTGRFRHDRLAAAGARQDRDGDDRLRGGRAGRRSTASKLVAAGDGARAEQDRRPQRHRPHRHGREPLRRHEEPRRVRSARHDDPLRRAIVSSSSSRWTAT